jgi:hypothetical protein
MTPMETKEFDLKRVEIKIYDDEDGLLKHYDSDTILTQKGNYNTYFGSSEIFRNYERVREQTIELLKRHKQRDILPVIEVTTIAYGIVESELDVIKNVFLIKGESEYIKTIYNRVQHYGGSEEGGWYYHTMEATKLTAEEVELDTDRYDNGYVLETELYFGENENLESQHYC